MSDTEADTMWLIVYAPRDDSFSLIKEDEAVFDKEHLEENDKVKFFYDGEEWEGIVRVIGNDDKYDSLKVRMDKLNAERKGKPDSFHEDRPRKTRGKGKFQEAMDALKPRKKLNPVAVKTKVDKPKGKTDNKTGTKATPLAMVLKEVQSGSADSGSDDDVESSPRSSPLPEGDPKNSSREASQIKRKNKDEDFRILKKLRSYVTSDDNGNAERSPPDSIIDSTDSAAKLGSSESELVPTSVKPAHSSGGSSKKTFPSNKGSAGLQTMSSSIKKSTGPIKRISIFGAGSNSTNMYEDSDEDTENPEQKEGDGKDKKKSKKSQKQEKEKKSEETCTAERESVLRWKEGDEDVILIQGRSKDLADKKFYVSTKDLQTAKSKDNATTFAKSLLVAAFTDEALYKHSLSGGQYRAAGKANITQKSALPADVVAVIADVALHRQSVKKWSPQQTKKEIMSGLRQKLVDIRSRLKKTLNL